MVQEGSALSVASKPAIARPNSKECSSATARSNDGCAAARHDVAKCTVPSFSAAVAPCSCSCAAAPDASVKTLTTPTTRDDRTIDHLLNSYHPSRMAVHNSAPSSVPTPTRDIMVGVKYGYTMNARPVASCGQRCCFLP